MMQHALAVPVVAMLTGATALGSTPIRLDEVRALSRENASVLLAELKQRQAAAAVELARASVYPQIAFSAGFVYTTTSTQRYYTALPIANAPGNMSYAEQAIDIPGTARPSFDAAISVNQLVYDGGRWWHQIAAAGAQEDAARGQQREEQMTAELEGVRRFYELFRAQRGLEVLEATAQRSLEQVDRAESLFTAGRVGRDEVLAAQVNLANDRIAVIQQKSRLVAMRAQLAAWIMRPLDEELRAVDPGTLGAEPSPSSYGDLPGSPPPTLESLCELAKQQRPLLRALSNLKRAAELEVDIAGAGYWPRISVSGALSRNGSTIDPYFTDPTKQNVLSAGVSMRWDLFSGFATRAQVAQALANVRSAQINLEQAERELRADVQRTLAALEAQIEAARIAAGNVQTARAGLELAEERFRTGTGSTLAVRDAQLKVVQTELVALESRIDVEIAHAALARAVGAGET
ncbi:MAG: TolC family protein [Deltaproteobacteria bacterium]|nr:TolC family protein [Deltaproteobacteria bacterium]